MQHKLQNVGKRIDLLKLLVAYVASNLEKYLMQDATFDSIYRFYW